MVYISVPAVVLHQRYPEEEGKSVGYSKLTLIWLICWPVEDA